MEQKNQTLTMSFLAAVLVLVVGVGGCIHRSRHGGGARPSEVHQSDACEAAPVGIQSPGVRWNGEFGHYPTAWHPWPCEVSMWDESEVAESSPAFSSSFEQGPPPPEILPNSAELVPAPVEELHKPREDGRSAPQSRSDS